MSFWRPLAHGLRVLFNRRAADEAVGDEVQHYFDETVDDLPCTGAVARGRPSRGTPGSRQRHRRSRAGSRKRLGAPDRQPAGGSALLGQKASRDTRLHTDRRLHSGSWHRCDDSSVQRRTPDPHRHAPVPGRRPDCHGPGSQHRRFTQRRIVRDLSRAG